MITKLSQLEQDQMYLLCIHIAYVLVRDSMRWDLMWPESISPTNQCCATCKGASSCAGAARTALAVPRTRGARPRRAPGKNRPGRLRLGRARARRAEPRDAGASPHAPGAMAKGTARAALGAPGAPRAGRAGPPRAATSASSLRVGAARAPGGHIRTPPCQGRAPAPGRSAAPRAWGRSGWLGRLVGAGRCAELPRRAAESEPRAHAGAARPRLWPLRRSRGRLGFGAGSGGASSSMGGGARSWGRRLMSMAGEGSRAGGGAAGGEGDDARFFEEGRVAPGGPRARVPAWVAAGLARGGGESACWVGRRNGPREERRCALGWDVGRQVGRGSPRGARPRGGLWLGAGPHSEAGPQGGLGRVVFSLLFSLFLALVFYVLFLCYFLLNSTSTQICGLRECTTRINQHTKRKDDPACRATIITLIGFYFTQLKTYIK
jgi:hypothetical protein